jgi:hypothetical protein
MADNLVARKVALKAVSKVDDLVE